MSRFVQLHLLTFYAPSNLNRDDLNRPKTAHVGGVQRLRVSSQSLKRAWRTSDVFDCFGAQVGEGDRALRTRDFRKLVFKPLVDGGLEPAQAATWTDKVMDNYKKKAGTKEKKEKDKEKKSISLDAKERFEFGHMLCLSAQEVAAIRGVVTALVNRQNPSDADLAKVLQKQETNTAVDLAMFGRMLADKPDFNVDAAVQVAHAFTVNKATVEDDFFTAVDDLNKREEDAGAGHMGEVEFGSGVFYLYICVDCDLLKKNLAGRPDLVRPAMRALAEAAATVAPTGKQNSFASRAYAQYLLAEKGDRQPRSLAVAFLRPVAGADQVGEAIERLRACRADMDRAYGALADDFREMSVPTQEGALAQVLDFVGEACA
ncbi:MAG: type I-E CRISPR-associated protein Cas7/Cse4/CasC [Thermodesulfobacteriota bacterium]